MDTLVRFSGLVRKGLRFRDPATPGGDERMFLLLRGAGGSAPGGDARQGPAQTWRAPTLPGSPHMRYE